MKKWSFSLWWLLLSGPLLAQSGLERFLANPLIQNANVSISIRKLQQGEVVEEYRSNHLVSPASTMKVITTATALEVLGSGYKYPTYLQYSGSIKEGVLHGNIYISGQGDPTLGGAHWGGKDFLRRWSKIIQKAGIKRIEGRVIGDISYYDGDAINPGWLYEDMGNYYAPSIFSLAYLDNTMNICLQSGAIGTIAQVLTTDPIVPNLQFENHIRCTACNNDGAYVHGLPYQNCRYLTGAVPSNRGTFGIKGDLPNPALLLAQHVTEQLRADGIVVTSPATYISEPDKQPRTLLYTHYSDTLGAIVEQTNLHSINLYAEMIFRNLGAQYGVPCTIHNSSDFVKQFWRNHGVDIFTAQILDGCGLSPQDGLCADHFVHLLTYMAKSKQYPIFLHSLPTSGESGTLRSFLANTELASRVHAKSGTIKGTRNYTGYIDMPNGEKWAFAILVSNSTGSGKQIQHAIEQYLLDVYQRNK